ncbi:FAD/NAD(P)-binding domain-containing protein [Hyaloscypha variabilis F]|uniref:FAD/NAD(P)-binding domain-containing protein n=1 Tax=Hyaloscypha variabilis (strain UAMH 11265 / GT02V1 / F) TaxID=1149755 RepID=A0A2J6RTA6_HYAVF|nr:FAD/NAD(P)-binding domain-containing protein [Hyaloscypha variabilis F]
MPLKIIVCGGGIGGLTVAGYLRAEHNVTVLERGNLDFTINDYGLSVVSNAFNLLQKAGIKSENLDSVVMTHLWMRSSNNDEIRTVHFDTRKERGGAPSMMTRRATLQSELLRFATSPEFPGAPAEIIQGAQVTRVDALEGKVWTEDGRSFEGDLIIGADGINSAARAAVLGHDTPLNGVKLHDLLCFITRVPIEIIRGESSLEYLANPSSQAGLVSFHLPPDSKSPKRLLIYHTSSHELQVLGYTSEQEFAQVFDTKKTAIIKDIPAKRVVDEFSTDFSKNLVDLFNHNQIDAWRIRDIDTCDTWYRGKCVLIGDAAHAVTPHAGHGCNLTIEDAEALAYLLKDAKPSDDLKPILEKFTSLRRERARFVLRRSREMGNIQSEEDKKLEPISPAEFSRVMHSYQGVEHALKKETSTSAA